MDPVTLYLSIIGVGFAWGLLELYNEFYPPHVAYYKIRKTYE